MQGWISLKQEAVAALGIAPDALRILAALLIMLVAAIITRRPLSHPLPWLAVLLAAGLNEAASLYGLRPGEDALRLAGRDVALALAMPTLLFLLGRFWPDLLSAHHDRRIFVAATREKRAPVVEAVIKTVEPRRAGGRQSG
jgi:hypothetical protein